MTHLANLLWKSRLKKEITCYTIARGMGYTNTNKGARKYLRWEQGEQYPEKEELDKLIQVMGLDPEEVQKAVEHDRMDCEKETRCSYQEGTKYGLRIRHYALWLNGWHGEVFHKGEWIRFLVGHGKVWKLGDRQWEESDLPDEVKEKLLKSYEDIWE